ncbi:hypothetical protein DFJ74DRAFT_422408 [Hyaloraphidium curvatum]|nr:hypothetical protein DFJ74DRAFT_422408 [Hyaloraphidium curvatum]
MRRQQISIAALAALAALAAAAPAGAAPSSCWPQVRRHKRQLVGTVDFGALAEEETYAGRALPADPVTTVSAGTPVVAACATLAVSADGRCGRFAGGSRCPDGKCCSQWGFCQDNGGDSGEAWCGTGCQYGYGKCFIPEWPRRLPSSICPSPTEPTETYTLTTTSNSVPVYMACPTLEATTDGRCGVQGGGKRCPKGLCCSEWGWCEDDGDDSGLPWCGGGCQLGYGKCFVGCKPVQTDFACPTAPPSAPTREAETDGTDPTHTVTRVSRGTPVYNACTKIPIADDYKCGSDVGKRCPPGLCCSQWGVCQVRSCSALPAFPCAHLTLRCAG